MPRIHCGVGRLGLYIAKNHTANKGDNMGSHFQTVGFDLPFKDIKALAEHIIRKEEYIISIGNNRIYGTASLSVGDGIEMWVIASIYELGNETEKELLIHTAFPVFKGKYNDYFQVIEVKEQNDVEAIMRADTVSKNDDMSSLEAELNFFAINYIPDELWALEEDTLIYGSIVGLAYYLESYIPVEEKLKKKIQREKPLGHRKGFADIDLLKKRFRDAKRYREKYKNKITEEEFIQDCRNLTKLRVGDTSFMKLLLPTVPDEKLGGFKYPENENERKYTTDFMVFGEIVEYKEFSNPLTKLPLIWMLVDIDVTYIEIIVDKKSFKGDIKKHNYVRGPIWLQGYIKGCSESEILKKQKDPVKSRWEGLIKISE